MRALECEGEGEVDGVGGEGVAGVDAAVVEGEGVGVVCVGDAGDALVDEFVEVSFEGGVVGLVVARAYVDDARVGVCPVRKFF